VGEDTTLSKLKVSPFRSTVTERRSVGKRGGREPGISVDSYSSRRRTVTLCPNLSLAPFLSMNMKQYLCPYCQRFGLQLEGDSLYCSRCEKQITDPPTERDAFEVSLAVSLRDKLVHARDQQANL